VEEPESLVHLESSSIPRSCVSWVASVPYRAVITAVVARFLKLLPDFKKVQNIAKRKTEKCLEVLGDVDASM
jgi:hypothetical protein